MGWLKEHKGQDGKTLYYAVYRDLHGRERSAGSFTSKREANQAWQDAESDLRAGKRIGDPKRGRQRFRDYVAEWFPDHAIELTTRESYGYLLELYILEEFGGMRMREIMPAHIRAWVLKLQKLKVGAPTIRKCKFIVDAIFTTALNDQVTVLHPGKGVKTPPAPRKPKQIITVEQFDLIYEALPSEVMRLLVETDIESGLRWGELTELRPKDIDLVTGIVTVSRAVVHLKAKNRPNGQRFVVKEYPKDEEWRQVKLDAYLITKIRSHIEVNSLGRSDLLFWMPAATAIRRKRPAELPDPDSLGMTDPNEKGRQYRHGTLSGYQLGKCRCRPCKDAVAAYRAERRAAGKDNPSTPRSVATDGHISGDWFRKSIWYKALETADIGVHVTPHGLRHAHASWLLAGGADLQTVKERLGHGSIATTQGYLHALPGAQDAALAALAAVRGDRAVTASLEAGKVEALAASERAGRDAELTELRAMVAKFKEILGPTENTA